MNILRPHQASRDKIIRCAVRTPIPFQCAPGAEVTWVVKATDSPMRPFGIRFARGCGAIYVKSMRSGNVENLMGEVPAQMFVPYMSDIEWAVLEERTRTDITDGVTFRLLIDGPNPRLDLSTIAPSQEMHIVLLNRGSNAVDTPIDVRAALFCDRLQGRIIT